MFTAEKSALLMGAEANSPHAAGWTGNVLVWLVSCPTFDPPCQQHLYYFSLAPYHAKDVSRLRTAAMLASAYRVQQSLQFTVHPRGRLGRWILHFSTFCKKEYQ